MKFIHMFSLLLLISTSVVAENRNEVYIIDFHNDKEYHSVLGGKIADDFENTLELCKSKYAIVPRERYEKELIDKNFKSTRRFLEKKGIEYIIYGDIFYDDNSAQCTIEYTVEELQTSTIILIETISFSNFAKLFDNSYRKQIIKEHLKQDEDLCKSSTEIGDLYIINFHNDKDFNSILGKNIANEFEQTLQLCKTHYHIIPRLKYLRTLKDQSFKTTKTFIKNEGIRYVMYGDIYHDDSTKKFIVEYILEDLETNTIRLIDQISFSHLSDLLNRPKRKKTFANKLGKEKELCSCRICMSKFLDKENSTDPDNDGVPYNLDKEPNTPEGVDVDKNGIQIASPKENLSHTFHKRPNLNNIPFEGKEVYTSNETMAELYQLASLMRMYPVLVINLEGTDSDNETIALERATKTKEYLVQYYRIEEKRLIVKSKADASAKSEVVVTIAFDQMDF